MATLTEIITWARNSLVAKGYVVNGSPETIHSTSWSSITKFVTSQGNFYLKQMPVALSLEPNIIKILSDQLHAKNVSIVIDVNESLNCFLMQDSGKPLREILKKNFQLDLLCQAVKEYAQIQNVTKDHVDIFLQLGVPDWRLEKLPLLYQDLVSKEDMLKFDGLTTDEFELLHKLSSKLLSVCELLAGYQIPAALDHCDFHANNVLIEDGAKKMTIIDWGETVITHPFFSLTNFLGTAVRHYDFKEGDEIYLALQDRFFANWQKFLSEANLLAAITLAKKLWPIYAALGFYRLGQCTDVLKSLSGRLTGYLRIWIESYGKDNL